MSANAPTLLRRWSAVREVAVDRMSDADVRWRSLGALFIAGGLLALASLLLPVEAETNVPAIVVVGVVAVLGGLVMIAGARRLPARDAWVSASLACGTGLITAAVILDHSVASAYAVIYVWVGFDGFFFLPRRHAFAHLLLVGVSYGIALFATRHTGSAEAGRWLLTIGTVSVIGTLADLLRERSNRSIQRLGDAARTDALTGLLNRRGFEERMANELERARRAGGPVSLVVGDLDHFKTINDRYGHPRGDATLRWFAETAGATTRVIDAVARIGGEEFALVLPGTDEHGAYLLAERLRRRVRDDQADPDARVSVSFGIATFPRHGDSTDELLRSADQALYLAKHLGRDRSVIFSPEVVTSLASAEQSTALGVEHLPAVLTLAETLDLRDTGTALHSQTVGRYARDIAVALGLPASRVERIRLAGLLHDIGKIGIPDPILRKPGPLDDAEWAEMRKHPELGARILASANLDDLSGWVLAHHERPDGAGYPSGLGVAEIPVEARILSVADSFEAMTSDRPYRRAMSADAATQELRRHAGTQFDADVIEAFFSVLDEAPALAP